MSNGKAKPSKPRASKKKALKVKKLLKPEKDLAMPNLVQEVENLYLKKKLPDVRPGDTVKVKFKIKEGNKERLQAYEGVVIKVRGSGLNKSITVRRVFQGVGVERVFPLHSPRVETIQILRRGNVRRSKLYYLRKLTGKAARIRERLGITRDELEAMSAPEVVALPEEPAAAEAAPAPEATAEAPAAEAPATEEQA